MLKIIGLLYLILLVSCNNNPTEEDYKVEITQVETNKEILLTSYKDYKYLLLLIPIELEIKNYGENQILSHWFKVYNCGIMKKYIPYFETDSIKLGFDYDKLETIKEYKMRKLTAYCIYKIFPDSLPSHRKFIADYNFIKKITVLLQIIKTTQ